MPHLTCTRVSASEKVPLSSLSFDVGDGECLALFGAEKAGVNAALECIAGLLPLAGGEILVDGRRIDQLSPSKRRIGMVFHDFALYPHMNVKENVLFALRARRLAPDLIQSRFERVCDFLQLGGMLDRKPQRITSFEKAVTALARALIDDPDLVLIQRLDRLNPDEKENFFRLLARARQEMRPTILFATSSAPEAFAFADRIAVIRGGRLVQIGAPEELYFRPIDSGIALAIANNKPALFKARIEAGAGGDAVVVSPSCRLPLAPAMETRLLDGQSVLLCVRPEYVRLCEEGVRGELVAIRRQIADSLLTVALENGVRISLKCSLRESMGLVLGNSLSFIIEGASLLIFDSGTGDALY